MKKFCERIQTDIDIIRFCMKQVHLMTKGILLVYLVLVILEIIVPFINLFFSAALLDELLNMRRYNYLLTEAISLVIVNFTFNSLRHLLNQRQQFYKADLSHRVDNTIANKFASLQYETVESPQTRELYTRYRNYDMWYGGLPVLIDNVFGLFLELGSLFISIIILVQLIFLPVNNHTSGLLEFVNTSSASFIIIVILLLNVFVIFKDNTRVSQMALNYEKDLSALNKKFFYFAFELPNDYPFGKDIRLYSIGNMINEELNNFFKTSHAHRAQYTGNVIKSETRSISVSTFSYGLIYLYSVLKALLGVVSTGSLMIYTGAAANFNTGLSRFSKNCSQVHLCAQMLLPFKEILEMSNSITQGNNNYTKKESEYRIEFKNVSFRYPGSQKDVLSNISFSIDNRKHLALVGPNGSGKSTLIKLLCRLYKPSSGSIYLNGINIQDYALPEYIRLITVVFQDFQLFSFSIGQNVSANSGYQENLTWECLRQAGIEKRVKDMPDKLDTHIYSYIDDKGIELSGGESQKIAIARALYKDSPIVILDEPTASLDPVSENEIYHHMNLVIKNKTAIFISHRLSSCRFSDEIIVLDKGKIVQQGSHELLVNDKVGLYKEMWEAQAKQYNAQM